MKWNMEKALKNLDIGLIPFGLGLGDEMFYLALSGRVRGYSARDPQTGRKVVAIDPAVLCAVAGVDKLDRFAAGMIY